MQLPHRLRPGWRADSAFPCSGRLLQHKHELRLIQVPGLAQGRVPVAHHEHGIVEAARGCRFQLGERHAAYCRPDFRIGLQSLGNGFINRQRWITQTNYSSEGGGGLAPASNERWECQRQHNRRKTIGMLHSSNSD